jgi:hypothetical protein
MPFRLITGTMGGGKSYYGAELAIQYWKEGAYVHTNMDMVEEEIEKRGWSDRFIKLGDEPTDWDQHLIGGAEGQENLVIIDEAMVIFDSMDWQANRKRHKNLMHFLTQSRKVGLDIFMIGQAQKGMDATFSRISLEVISCTAVKRWPLIGPFWVTLRGDFCRATKYPNGQRAAPLKFVRFNPEVGSIYRTESTHGRFDGVERRVTRAPKSEKLSRLKAWALLITFVVSMLTIFFLLRHAWKVMFVSPEKPADVSGSRSEQPPRQVTTPEPAPRSAHPAASHAAPAPGRFKVWGCADWGRVTFWEAVTGVQVIAGGVYDEAIVQSLDMSRRIFKARLDDGRTIEFRPATRADAPKPEKIEPEKPSWKSLSLAPSPAST